MNNTIWIFVFNSYPSNKSSVGFLKNIQNQIDNLSSLSICKMTAHRHFINLTKEDLYSKFDEMIQESEYKNAKQLIFIFRGYGDELIEHNTSGILSLDGQTIFFNRLIDHFFKNTNKNIYIIADLCRAPIEDTFLNTSTLTTNKGHFILIYGITKKESIYGIFGKYIFQKLDLICDNQLDLRKFLLIMRIILLSARYDDPILDSRIYVNNIVQTKYPKIVNSIQQITNQDYVSIRANKLYLDSECSNLTHEISTHKHEYLTCANIIKKFVNKCRYYTEDETILKPCIDICASGIVYYENKIEEIRKNNKFTEMNQSKNIFRLFSYWKTLGVYTSTLLFLSKTLSNYKTKGFIKIKEIIDKYSPLQLQINGKLIPLSNRIENFYQRLKFGDVVKLLNEMKTNPIINKNETIAIENMLIQYDKLDILRNSGDISDSIKNFNYFNSMKSNVANNKLIDLLAKLENLYHPFYKIFIDSHRKDITALKKLIEYFDTLKTQNLTQNEKNVITNLLQNLTSQP